MSAMRDNAGVIAPPPLIFAGALGIGLLVDFLLLRVGTGLPAGLRYGVAALLLIAGTALAGAALRRFRRAGTSPEPWRRTTAIVTDGVYAFTRNPMYLAMSLIYLAIALALDGPATLLLLIPVVLTIQYGVIRREERYLEAKFGDAYRHYRARVRRWL